MKPENLYLRYVRWSDEDECFIGYCPDLFFGGVCHAEIEEDCYAQLCSIIRDEITHLTSQSTELPAASARVTRDLELAGI